MNHWRPSLSLFFCILLGLIVLVSRPLAWAADEAELVVKLGQGRAQVTVYGFEMSEEARRRFETDLMTDRNLADRVVSSATTEVHIRGPAIAGIDRKLLEDPNSVLQELAGLVHLQILGTTRRGDATKGTDVGDQNRRVVVGGRFELKEGESLEELVVLGGQAEIRGKVARLSLMGGRVHIYETAQVTEELVNLGGQVIIDQGAKIERQPYEVFTPFDDSFRFLWESHDELPFWDFFKSPAWIWGFRLFKLLAFLVVALVLVLLAPDFFAQVKAEIVGGPGTSLLFGLGAVLGYVPLAFALILTIVGISLLPLQALVFFYALVMGCVAVMVGLLSRLRMGGFPLWVQVMVAVLLLEAIGWLPYVGSTWHVIVSLVGLGAVFRVLWRRVWRKSVAQPPLATSH